MSTLRAVVFVLLIVLTWGLFYGVICALVEISIVRKHRRSPKTRQPVSGREKAAGKPFSLEQLAALAEELRDYAAARQAAEAVRQRAARFETVRASGEVGAAAGGQGGVRTSVSAQMQVTGLAGAQTAWSMAEISRFFERDARRYGG